MNEIEQLIETMSTEELQAILDTEFPEELEKQAEAEVAEAELADALYAYGAFIADREFAESDESGLSKEASAEFDEAEAEISAMIDEGVTSLGVAEEQDPIALHEAAQAAAAVILEGYTDQLEKIAAKKAKESALQSVKKFVKKKLKAGKEHAEAAGRYVKKHHKPILGGAAVGALGTVGAMKAKEHMDKRASEFTAEELLQMVREDAAEMACVYDGIEKLAGKGKKKAAQGVMASIKRGYRKAVKSMGEMKDKGVAKAKAAGKYLKQNAKPIAGGAAAGGLAGAGATYAAMSRKDRGME